MDQLLLICESIFEIENKFFGFNQKFNFNKFSEFIKRISLNLEEEIQLFNNNLKNFKAKKYEIEKEIVNYYSNNDSYKNIV